MKRLSAAYAWLHGVGTLPLMVQRGLETYGTLEAPGDANNPTILEWAKEVGLDRIYRHDVTPWCGLWAALVAKRAGKPVVRDALWALNWSKFGIPSERASLGDVLTFRRPSGGHVGLYIAEDDEAFHVLGGNQSDAVTITRIAKGRLYKARRPDYRNQPASVRPYIVKSSGDLSTNEA